MFANKQTFLIHDAEKDCSQSLSQLFDHDDAEQITKIATEIRDTNTGAFDASELLQRLEHLDEPFQSKHWIFSSPLIMFCFLRIFSRFEVFAHP